MHEKEYAVGWLTLSLVIAGIAQGKNRSGLGWWFLGLIFGPFALLVLLLLDRGHDYNAMEQRIAARISEQVRDIPRASGTPS